MGVNFDGFRLSGDLKSQGGKGILNRTWNDDSQLPHCGRLTENWPQMIPFSVFMLLGNLLLLHMEWPSDLLLVCQTQQKWWDGTSVIRLPETVTSVLRANSVPCWLCWSKLPCWRGPYGQELRPSVQQSAGTESCQQSPQFRIGVSLIWASDETAALAHILMAAL